MVFWRRSEKIGFIVSCRSNACFCRPSGTSRYKNATPAQKCRASIGVSLRDLSDSATQGKKFVPEETIEDWYPKFIDKRRPTTHNAKCSLRLHELRPNRAIFCALNCSGNESHTRDSIVNGRKIDVTGDRFTVYFCFDRPRRFQIDIGKRFDERFRMSER
jgi:hypothetical protein